MKRNTKGFTLIETLVAISILLVVISAAFGAAQNGIILSTFSKNQIISFYLAGEGVEQIRNMRDENGLKGQNWLTGIAYNSNDLCYFGKTCTIDAVNNVIGSCPSGFNSCPFLQENKTTGFYGYNVDTTNWPNTIFRREIQLKSINADEVSVTVRMSWTQGAISRNFEIRENIFNWH
jgi:prepilin-type N-terminal cleavage/methylation domain-containing protein